MIKNNIKLCSLFVVFLMTACGNDREINSIKNELDNKKNTMVISKRVKPSSDVTRLSEIRYHGGDRNPFEVKAVVLDEKKGLDPLNMFSLNALRFVGTIIQGKKMYAVIITPDNLTYKVKKGDSLGDHYGKVIAIDTSKIKIMESFTESEKKVTQRTVTLQLKDKQ